MRTRESTSRMVALAWVTLAAVACTPDPATPADRHAGASDNSSAAKNDDAGTPPEICDPGAPTAAALRPGGVGEDDALIIPGGRRVVPDGRSVTLGRAPIGLALSPDGQLAYVTNDGDRDESLEVVDLDSGEVTQTLSGFKAFRGVATAPDGRLFVAAGPSGRLLTYAPDADGQLQAGPELALSGYLGDLVLSPDGATLYVADNTTSTIWVIDAATLEIQRTFTAGNLPYDLVLDPAGTRLFVSNLGGSTLQVFDVSDGTVLAELETPQGPEGMALDPVEGRLYVPCADEDVIWVLDTATLLEVDTLDLSHSPEGLLAASPNDVALSPDGTRLYVVQADLNQVDVVDARSGEVEGSIPTGWYPVGVEAHPDGERLVVINAKGMGSGVSQRDPRGTLEIIGLPAHDALLAAKTVRAAEYNARPSTFYRRQCPEVMATADGRPPIEHVVLIVRENKTYDMDLGDLEGANGDPELVLFGEPITPNLHALAREFVNMDNFHSDPEVSLQGHLWTTQADCGDFTEKLRHTLLPLTGFEPASISPAGSIFTHCLAHGISFRNYGEVVAFGADVLGDMRDYVDPKYPFFNMAVLDVDKAREVIREWSNGIFPRFIYISLPDDHTFGTKPGKPTPESMVADNDHATGLLVEWLSRSPYWDKTAIFIIEDDPQSHAGDHVDAHRSISLVVSPWVRRRYVSHVNYNIPSLYRTVEMLLGLPPMNKNDAGAAPMYDIFLGPDDAPDLTPYTAIEPGVQKALNTWDSPMAAESDALDFGEDVDGVAGLGRILWYARKGVGVEPPAYAKGVDR